jgi:hypothetical protein
MKAASALYAILVERLAGDLFLESIGHILLLRLWDRALRH